MGLRAARPQTKLHSESGLSRVSNGYVLAQSINHDITWKIMSQLPPEWDQHTSLKEQHQALCRCRRRCLPPH